MTVIREITHTKQWIEQVIIGLNFCPFAKKEFINKTIHYHASDEEQLKSALLTLLSQCQYLQEQPAIETSLLIFSEWTKV